MAGYSNKKSLRLSERWFRRGLWLVAVIFAMFLIGLGRTIIGDLPKVENTLEVEQFVNQETYQKNKTHLEQIEKQLTNTNNNIEKAQAELIGAQNTLHSAENTYNDWLKSRSATEQNEQNPEVIARAKALEPLRQNVRSAQITIENEEKTLITLSQQKTELENAQQELQEAAYPAFEKAQNRQELLVFIYRLLITLPLLIIAGWLWKRYRKSKHWPFVWGFIFFAMFAFFVELVPYLPSYGGYVRYVVGIIVTFVIGQQAIVALSRYLERQKEVEAMPEAVRRQTLDYDKVFSFLAKGVCPSCERGLRLEDDTLDFCPHCGISLHNHCTNCNTRKSSFASFCQVCGLKADSVTVADK